MTCVNQPELGGASTYLLTLMQLSIVKNLRCEWYSCVLLLHLGCVLLLHLRK